MGSVSPQWSQVAAWRALSRPWPHNHSSDTRVKREIDRQLEGKGRSLFRVTLEATTIEPHNLSTIRERKNGTMIEVSALPCGLWGPVLFFLGFSNALFPTRAKAWAARLWGRHDVAYPNTTQRRRLLTDRLRRSKPARLGCVVRVDCARPPWVPMPAPGPPRSEQRSK